MLFRRIRRIVRTVTAVGITLLAFLIVWATGVVRFSELSGVRTFYLNGTSSQALMKERLDLSDFGKITGESVRFACEDKRIAEEIIARYGGTVLFTEETGNVRSYYCYTDEWSGGIWIGEHFVNLHVAVGEGACTVGVPIIFGGY